MPDSEQTDLARLTVDLLSAYFANNSVPSSDLAGLIEQTRSALAGAATAPATSEPVHTPAVSIEESVASRDHILSLIDGKPYKSLKRHLANNGLTPAEYRTRYGLPGDYPMVAPTYSEHRRAVAQRMGLGGRPGKAKEPAVTTGTEKFPPVKEPAPKPAAPKAKAAPEKKEAAKSAAAAKSRKRFAREPKPEAKAVAQPVADVAAGATAAPAAAASPETPKAKSKTSPKKAAAPKRTAASANTASATTPPAADAGKKDAPKAPASSNAVSKPSPAKKPKAAKAPSATANAKAAGASPRRARAKNETTGTAE